MDKKWYVVYTKPGSEKKVSETLTRRKIENYCPINVIAKKNRDNTAVKEAPIFKGYVFVKTTNEEHEELKKINGVVNFVYWLGTPVSVKNSEMKAMILFLNDYSNISIEKTEIKGNDKVNIIDGCIVEQEAPLITIKNKKAYVVLSSLGCIMSAEVEVPKVRIISPDRMIKSTNSKTNTLFDKVSGLNNSLKAYWSKA
jgi:transcription antitermination factor NusG